MFFTPRMRSRLRYLLLSLLFNIVLEAQANAIKQERKLKDTDQKGRNKNWKLCNFLHKKTLSNLPKKKKKHLELIREFSMVTVDKMNVQK